MATFTDKDMVMVTDDQAKRTFGLGNTHWAVKKVSGDMVTLSNGLSFHSRHLTLVSTPVVTSSQNQGDGYTKPAKLTKVSQEKFEELITDVLDDWVVKNKMFTVYDVTKELRKQNPTTNINHDEVRKYIEENYKDDFGLERTLITITGVTTPPWLYHQDDQDPSDYGKDPNKNNVSMSCSSDESEVFTFYFK